MKPTYSHVVKSSVSSVDTLVDISALKAQRNPDHVVISVDAVTRDERESDQANELKQTSKKILLNKKKHRRRKCCLWSCTILLSVVVMLALAGYLVVGKLPSMESSGYAIKDVNLPSNIGLDLLKGPLTVSMDITSNTQIRSYSYIPFTIDNLNITIFTSGTDEVLGSARPPPIVIEPRTVTNITIPMRISVTGSLQSPVIAGILRSCGVTGDASPLKLHYVVYADIMFFKGLKVKEDDISVDCPVTSSNINSLIDNVLKMPAVGDVVNTVTGKVNGVLAGSGLEGIVNSVPDTVANVVPQITSNVLPSVAANVVNGGNNVVQQVAGDRKSVV